MFHQSLICETSSRILGNLLQFFMCNIALPPEYHNAANKTKTKQIPPIRSGGEINTRNMPDYIAKYIYVYIE